MMLSMNVGKSSFQSLQLILLFIFSLLLVTVGSCRGGRILVGYAPDSKSHIRSLLPFINRLADSGHQVTIFYIHTEASGQPERFSHPNISATMVELPDTTTATSRARLGTIIWKESFHSTHLVYAFWMFAQSLHTLLTHGAPQLAGVLNAAAGEQPWDFVLVSDLFALHAEGFAWMLNHQGAGVPYALFSSAGLLSPDNYRTALARNWVSKAQMYTALPEEGSWDVYAPQRFDHRLSNVLAHATELVGMHLLHHFLMPNPVDRITGSGGRGSGARDSFSRSSLFLESSLQLTDAISLLGGGQSSPIAHEIVDVSAHCEEPKPLAGEFLQFVEGDSTSKEGTIYIAFGTVIPWDYAPEDVKETIFSALELLPDYRILFAYNGKFPNRRMGKHIKLVKWAPQLDVLAHASTRVFLTHGGLKSVKEALCTRTPMLVMPMFAEQNHNARMVLALGIGSALNKFRLSAAGVAAALREVLERPAYAQRVAKLQRVFLDGGPLPALDLGAHRVSRLVAIADFGSKKHVFLKRKGMHLGLLEYFHLDLILLLLSTCILITMK